MRAIYPNQLFYPCEPYYFQQCVCQPDFSGVHSLQNACQENLAEWYRHQIEQSCCVTLNSLNSRTNKYCSKKESWIEKMDKLIFPNDPIRDWVENEVERISREYDWISQV